MSLSQNTAHHYERPATPQTLQHQAPTTKFLDDSTTPQKYIILIQAPTHIAGKVQIATHVSQRLSCPLFQGDSLHESCAKAAAVGRSEDRGRARYKRMWFNKMVRTGLLFPESSRPIFDGSVRERRGSDSSVSSYMSAASSRDGDATLSSSLASSVMDEVDKHFSTLTAYVNAPISAHSRVDAMERKANPALMVLTHPEMQQWHKDVIREAVKEYAIGVLFVPLYDEEYEEEDKSPILQPLNQSMVREFQSFDQMRLALGKHRDMQYGHGMKGNLSEEMRLRVDVSGTVDEIIKDVAAAAKDVMFG